MLLILEIAMFVGGIYAIFSAKVPSFLVGGGNYQVEGTTARLFGVLLILPMPIAFIGGIILALLFGKDATSYAVILEVAIVLGVAIIATVFARVAGKRVEPVNDVEAIIARKSQGALMYAIFSVTGFAALICCPLAIVYANQALKLIDENHIGEQHRNKAQIARVLAIVFAALWVIGIICFASVMYIGTR
jgi:hypothetical protein